MIDFIQQLKTFHEIASGNLTPNAISIYLHLFMVNNRCGWKEWFEESDYWIGSAVGIKRRETILTAINLLKQKGFIDFERGIKRNQATKYKIIALLNSAEHSAKDSAKPSSKPSAKDSAKDSAKPSAEHSDNPKHKTKTKTETETKRSARAFVPPTLAEVNEYVLEKGLHVPAKDFYDYFTAGNWVDSKGNKVQNWKQKLLTWEKFQPKQKLSTNNPQSNPQVEMCKRVIDFFNNEGSDVE